jgi:hypothetical protein
MNRPQHRAGDIVGVHLVAAHHQQGRALLGERGVGQQAVDAQQAVGGRVVRFAAGTVHQLMNAAVQHKAGALGVAIQQVRRPLGNGTGVDQQVIVDHHVLGQGVVQRYVDQVDKRLAAYRHDRALALVQRYRQDCPANRSLRVNASSRLPTSHNTRRRGSRRRSSGPASTAGSVSGNGMQARAQAGPNRKL